MNKMRAIVITGVFLITVLMVAMSFTGIAQQSNNKIVPANINSVNSKNSYSKISNENIRQKLISGSSIAVQFENWYKSKYNGNSPKSMDNITVSQRDMIFANFIHSDPLAQKLLMLKVSNL